MGFVFSFFEETKLTHLWGESEEHLMILPAKKEERELEIQVLINSNKLKLCQVKKLLVDPHENNLPNIGVLPSASIF